jgi:signal transduction histidine kinase
VTPRGHGEGSAATYCDGACVYTDTDPAHCGSCDGVCDTGAGSVCDQGAGIPVEELDRIFTPFYRSPSTSGHTQGFGIGLAVCRRLIEAQDGRMWAEAREEGGTRFTFSLPVADEDADDEH